MLKFIFTALLLLIATPAFACNQYYDDNCPFGEDMSDEPEGPTMLDVMGAMAIQASHGQAGAPNNNLHQPMQAEPSYEPAYQEPRMSAKRRHACARMENGTGDNPDEDAWECAHGR